MAARGENSQIASQAARWELAASPFGGMPMRQPLDLLAESRIRVPNVAALAELRADIMRVAYLRGDFELSRGLRRNYYFDKYAFQTRPAILRRLGRFLAELVPHETDRLAAPALGAVALGTAVSIRTRV
jgi:hypothetical protein